MMEFVNIPVPREFVPDVYRLLAELTTACSPGTPTQGQGREAPQVLVGQHRMDDRYRRIRDYLAGQQGSSVTLTVDEIEDGICSGASLPDSARQHRAWWANTASHSHAAAWLSAGFDVAKVARDEQGVICEVAFRRRD